MTKLSLEEFNDTLFATILTILLREENIKAAVEETMVGYKVRRLTLCTAYEIKKRESCGFLYRLFGKEYYAVVNRQWLEITLSDDEGLRIISI